VSAATSQPPQEGMPASEPPRAQAGEACPVCGAPLHPEQAWCLSCGAAARTRLAPAPPGWKRPIAAFAGVVVLALGVLAAALIDLAGGSTSVPATTTTVTTSAPATTPSTTTATGAATTPTTPATTTTTAPGSTATPSTGAATTTTPSVTSTVTTTAPKTSSAPKINGKTKSAITKGIEEALRRSHGKRLFPGTGVPAG
jgi:hypothetical protein